MTTSTGDIATLVLAGVAVVGLIGSVLTLAFRVGRLAGTMQGFMATTLSDNRHLWEEYGKLSERLSRHIEHRSTHS